MRIELTCALTLSTCTIEREKYQRILKMELNLLLESIENSCWQETCSQLVHELRMYLSSNCTCTGLTVIS